jgi:hypothetical protein
MHLSKSTGSSRVVAHVKDMRTVRWLKASDHCAFGKRTEGRDADLAIC